MSVVSVVRVRVVLTAAFWTALSVQTALAQPSGGERASVAQPSAAERASVAQPSGGGPASAPRAGEGPSVTSPLRVWIADGGTPFDRAGLQAALERELGRRVEFSAEPQPASVRITLDGGAHAEVEYTAPSGEQLARRVDLPPDRQRSVQVVTWLTVNLVRDEASELLDELRARRREEAAARAAAEHAEAERAAAQKAAAEQAAAERAAAEKAAAEAARKRAAQAKSAENTAGGPKNPGLLRDPLRSFDAALATPISVVRDSPKRALKMQLALWYGEAGGIEGVSASLAALRVRRDLFGVATSIGATIVSGNARGVVLSGGYTHVEGVLDGVQIGGGAAWHRGRFARGALIAGGGVLAGDLIGIEVAGGFASARSLNGVATAGGANVIRGPSKGLLLSGGVNVSASHRGLEVTGGLNTARDLDGLALAPINLHRRVRGLQLGVVNIAEQVDGAAIGVVSYARSGKLQPLLWSSTDGSVHVGLKSTVGWAFTQLGAGIDLSAATFSYDGGIGVHIKLAEDLFLEPGLHYSATHETADASGAPDEHRFHYIALIGYRAGNKLDLLGGGGVRHTFVGGPARAVPELRAGIAFF